MAQRCDLIVRNTFYELVLAEGPEVFRRTVSEPVLCTSTSRLAPEDGTLPSSDLQLRPGESGFGRRGRNGSTSRWADAQDDVGWDQIWGLMLMIMIARPGWDWDSPPTESTCSGPESAGDSESDWAWEPGSELDGDDSVE